MNVPVSDYEVEAIIFDMDGVLIDSGDVYERHWRRWGARHGLDYAVDIAMVHPGRPPTETIRLVAPRLDAVSEAARFNADLDASDDADAATAMPGAIELVGLLPQGRWGIATSASRDIAVQWLGHAGLPVPDALVTASDVARGKPAPDPYLLAAELLGRDAGRCLVIEDAPAGITAAKAAGATVLAIETTHAAPDLAEADAVASSLEAVRIVLRSDHLVVSWSGDGVAE